MINCETNVSGKLCCLNSHLRMTIVERVSADALGMGVDHNQKVMTIDRVTKVHICQGSWLLWSFRSNDRCSRRFERRCGITLSAASEVIYKDCRKTLVVIGLVRNSTLSRRYRNFITNRIEWYTQKTT